MKRVAVLLVACAVGAAAAEEHVTVCAREGAQGKAYQVEAVTLSGQELIAQTHSFQYSPFSRYVVIFWAQNQASVIELEYPLLGVIDTPGHDQQGRQWNVSTNMYCF